MSQVAKGARAMQEDVARAVLRTKIYGDIGAEHGRQLSKWKVQHHPHYNPGSSIRRWASKRARAQRVTDEHARAGTVTWEDILWEEVCEAMAETEWAKRREELIQVAAVIVSEIEDGDFHSGASGRLHS